MGKFEKIYNLIMEECSSSLKTDELWFKTVRDAQNYLIKHFDGHGTIYDKNGDVIQMCRCMASQHKNYNFPKIYVKTTVEEWEKQFEWLQK